MDLAALRRVLLALVGTGPAPDTAALSRADWSRLDAMAAQHRIQPLLHSRHSNSAFLPDQIVSTWRGAHRIAALEAMVSAQDLRDTVQLLEQHGHQPIALKGAWLSCYAYGEAAQRPMRDVDLLLTPDDVIAAYHTLLGAGYLVAKAPEMALEDVLRLDKHMPPLIAPKGTWIELHHRLWEPDGRLEHTSPTGREAEIRRRAITGPDGLRYPAPQDTLAHLIVHAVYGHRLNCGPLILSDIDLMLKVFPIDWSLLWADARADGWRDGARLVLELVARWRPGAPIDFAPDQGDPAPVEFLEGGSDLLLQDLSTRASANLLAAVLKARPGRLLRRLTGRKGAAGELEVQREMGHEGGFIGWALSRAWRSTSQLVRADVRRQSRQLAQLSKWLDR